MNLYGHVLRRVLDVEVKGQGRKERQIMTCKRRVKGGMHEG